MSESNEATPTALISDFLIEKSLKAQGSVTGSDSGFISCENLSTEYTDSNSCEDHIEEAEIMKVEGVLDVVTEEFTKLKLQNPFLNDLSGNRIAQKFFAPDEYGDTYLHAAILQGHSVLTLALIRTCPSPDYLNITNEEGFAPLHIAVMTNQAHLVRWLVVAGAQPELRNIRGEAPLHMAARLGHVKCCKAIAEPVHCEEREILKLQYQITCPKLINLEKWDYQGQTCIHIAAINGHIDVISLLIYHGANINARDGTSGNTALHYAMETQNDKLAYFLLTQCSKLDIDVTNYAGRSVLQLGFPVSNELTNFLLSKGVDSSYFSEEEMMEDSDDDISCQKPSTFLHAMVDSCA